MAEVNAQGQRHSFRRAKVSGAREQCATCQVAAPTGIGRKCHNVYGHYPETARRTIASLLQALVSENNALLGSHPAARPAESFAVTSHAVELMQQAHQFHFFPGAAAPENV